MTQVDTIQHLTVFLTQPLPPDAGCTVHFMLPLLNQPWKFLGILTNEKPSATFKLGNMQSSPAAQLGLSIEPLASVIGQQQLNQQQQQQNKLKLLTSSSSGAAEEQNTTKEIASKLLESLYNHVMSFDPSASQFGSNQQQIPVKIFQVRSLIIHFQSRYIKQWYESTLRKISASTQQQLQL